MLTPGPDPPPHLPRSRVAKCRSRSCRLPPRPRPSGWVEPPGGAPDGAARAPRGACRAEPAASPQCLPPARAHSPRERSALKSTAPRQREAPPGEGEATARPAPREAATGRSAQSCTGRAGTKRLTSLWLGSPTLLCILSFPVCAPGRPCENAKGRRTRSEPPLGSRVQAGTRHLNSQAAPPLPIPGSACFPAVTVSPTSCQAWRLALPVCPGVYLGHVQLRLGSRDFGAPVPRFRACQSVNPP